MSNEKKQCALGAWKYGTYSVPTGTLMEHWKRSFLDFSDNLIDP